MTIYDVLRHLCESTSWGGPDDVSERAKRATAVRLIDRLEDQGLLGQVAIDVEEEM